MHKILQSDSTDFESIALEVFKYQYQYNRLYRQYVDLLGVKTHQINSIFDIPHLPIQFFKTHHVTTHDFEPEKIFTSSGTTGTATSKHHIRNTDWYNQVSKRIFEEEYGSLNQFRILALLPSYLEREGSSLIHMVQYFMEQNPKKGGFYLHNFDELKQALQQDFEGTTLLIGVSFALWELAEKYKTPLKNTIVMETGGMKGRRKEITRKELHWILCDAFKVEEIHSEYGMTELLSQAYSQGEGTFMMNHFMKTWTREITDPFAVQEQGKVGAINIIDLANIDSCSFIATDDLGKLTSSNSFEILGRLDQSDVRGCNLMVYL